MSTEIIAAKPQTVIVSKTEHPLPAMVERAGATGRFAWDEFFFAEHHNPHTQKAYLRAVKAFLSWVEGKGVELPAITPGMVGQYLVGLGGSPSKRNLHLSALRGFFDRLVNRHVVILNPAASVKGVKDEVVEGKTPEMAIEQATPGEIPGAIRLVGSAPGRIDWVGLRRGGGRLRGRSRVGGVLGDRQSS